MEAGKKGKGGGQGGSMSESIQKISGPGSSRSTLDGVNVALDGKNKIK